jgi:Ulp1 family protease
MLLHSNSSFLVTFITYTLKQKKTADTHHQTSNHNNQILIKITFALWRGLGTQNSGTQG